MTSQARAGPRGKGGCRVRGGERRKPSLPHPDGVTVPSLSWGLWEAQSSEISEVSEV